MLDKGLVDVNVMACSYVSLSYYVNYSMHLRVTTILIEGLAYPLLFP